MVQMESYWLRSEEPQYYLLNRLAGVLQTRQCTYDRTLAKRMCEYFCYIAQHNSTHSVVWIALNGQLHRVVQYNTDIELELPLTSIQHRLAVSLVVLFTNGHPVVSRRIRVVCNVTTDCSVCQHWRGAMWTQAPNSLRTVRLAYWI